MKSKMITVVLNTAVVCTGFSLPSLAQQSISTAEQQPTMIAYAGPEMQVGFGPVSNMRPMHPHDCSHRSPHMIPMINVDLTDAQVEKLAQLEDEFKDKVVLIRIKMHSLIREYRRLLLQPEIDTAAINKLRSQIAAQKEVFDNYLTEHLISVAQVLTPEQRRKIELAMDRRELRHMGYRSPSEHRISSQSPE